MSELPELIINTQINNEIFIIGKLNSHLCNTKYNFDACNLYISYQNKVYHSIMKSEECYSNSLKWTQNFFMKIRKALIFPENYTNSTKFLISSEIVKDENEFTEEEYTYFKIIMQVEDKEITVFRLLLKEIIDDDADFIFIDKLNQIEREINKKLKEKQKILQNNVIELNKLKEQNKVNEEKFSEEKKNFLIKFYHIYNEKEQKIQEFIEESEKINN